MNAVEITYLISPLIIAGLAHAIVIKRDYLSVLSIPIDCGLQWRSRPILGSNKTWRGIAVTAVTTTAVVGFQRAIAVASPLSTPNPVDYRHLNWVVFGLSLGLAYSLSEFPNSFVKRRLAIDPGETTERHFLAQYVLDQADSAIGVGLLLYFVYSVSLIDAIKVIVVGAFIHAAIDQLLYVLKVKRWHGFESPFIGPSVALVQLIAWPLLRLFLRLICRGRVRCDFHPVRQTQARYIMLLDGMGRTDLILVLAALPLSGLLRVVPIRYIGVERHPSALPLNWLLILCGWFDASSDALNVDWAERARQALDSKQTLCIDLRRISSSLNATGITADLASLANDPSDLIIPARIRREGQGPTFQVSIEIADAYDAINLAPG